MKIYVCKMCGRAMKAEKQPNYCYADRMDSIEEVSEEDSVKMGLFSTSQGSLITDLYGNEVVIEFFRDMKFCPVDGQQVHFRTEPSGSTLTDFQNHIMEKVRA